MGAIPIHYTVKKETYKDPVQAYRELVDEALYEYGHDPYSGTIATCELQGKISKPKDDEAFDKQLDAIHKRDCWYYEDDEYYHFIGWAAC